jgi:hypothetical protein
MLGQRAASARSSSISVDHLYQDVRFGDTLYCNQKQYFRDDGKPLTPVALKVCSLAARRMLVSLHQSEEIILFGYQHSHTSNV